MQRGLFSVLQTAHMCDILLGWSRPEQSGHEARRQRRKQGKLAQVICVSLLYDDNKGQSLTSSKFLPEDKCSELKPLPWFQGQLHIKKNLTEVSLDSSVQEKASCGPLLKMLYALCDLHRPPAATSKNWNNRAASPQDSGWVHLPSSRHHTIKPAN